jgi:hypothetical protein
VKFLVEYTDDPGTRFNVTPEQLAHVLGILAESAGRINSAGKVPAVKVTNLDCLNVSAFWCYGCSLQLVEEDGQLCQNCLTPLETPKTSEPTGVRG